MKRPFSLSTGSVRRQVAHHAFIRGSLFIPHGRATMSVFNSESACTRIVHLCWCCCVGARATRLLPPVIAADDSLFRWMHIATTSLFCPPLRFRCQKKKNPEFQRMNKTQNLLGSQWNLTWWIHFPTTAREMEKVLGGTLAIEMHRDTLSQHQHQQYSLIHARWCLFPRVTGQEKKKPVRINDDEWGGAISIKSYYSM